VPIAPELVARLCMLEGRVCGDGWIEGQCHDDRFFENVMREA
jgi:hypothetical protein